MPVITEIVCGQVQKRYECEHCAERFGTYEELRVHKKVHPKKKSKHPCDDCGKVYTKVERLRGHMLKVHNSELKKKRRRSKYIVEEDDPRPYKCRECPSEFVKYKQLNKHLKVHEKRFCPFCQDYVQSFAMHMQKEHHFMVPRPFLCDICQRSFLTKNGIKIHMKAHASGKEIPMMKRRQKSNNVENCSGQNVFGPKLEAEVNSADVIKEETTNDLNVENMLITDLGFVKLKEKKKKSAKRTGRLSKNPDVDSRKRKCTKCKRAYHNPDMHLLRHHADRDQPLECFDCHMVFKKLGDLRLHLFIHSGTRNFICHVCGKAYFKNVDLSRHIHDAHSTKDPYKCEVCGKLCKNRPSLNVHQLIHSTLRPHKCHLCKLAFKTPGALRIHLRRHTDEKKHVCKFCAKAFRDRTSLLLHERMHTGKNKATPYPHRTAIIIIFISVQFHR